jgi:hypothetical protein
MSEPHFGMFHLRELDVGWSACRTIWAVESQRALVRHADGAQLEFVGGS